MPPTPDTDVNFAIPAGPPVHAKYPGVFDRTGGDRIGNGAHFGLCLGILGKRGPSLARIGGVVKSEKMMVWEWFFRRIVGFFSFSRVPCEFFLKRDSREIFESKSARNFSIRVCRENFNQDSIGSDQFFKRDRDRDEKFSIRVCLKNRNRSLPGIFQSRSG